MTKPLEDYPKIHTALLSSPEWEAWRKHNERPGEGIKRWDVGETGAVGIMSNEHFAAFMEFIREEERDRIKNKIGIIKNQIHEVIGTHKHDWVLDMVKESI